MWHTENTKTKQEEVTAAYDEQVLIQDAWDEPIYARVGICNRCGHEFLDPNEDITIHMEAGCWSVGIQSHVRLERSTMMRFIKLCITTQRQPPSTTKQPVTMNR